MFKIWLFEYMSACVRACMCVRARVCVIMHELK